MRERVTIPRPLVSFDFLRTLLGLGNWSVRTRRAPPLLISLRDPPRCSRFSFHQSQRSAAPNSGTSPTTTKAHRPYRDFQRAVHHIIDMTGVGEGAEYTCFQGVRVVRLGPGPDPRDPRRPPVIHRRRVLGRVLQLLGIWLVNGWLVNKGGRSARRAYMFILDLNEHGRIEKREATKSQRDSGSYPPAPKNRRTGLAL